MLDNADNLGKNMKKIMSLINKYLILSLLMSFLLSTVTFGQATNDDLDALVNDTKSDLLIVVGGGLAGAVLGLSTLSFVEEPKDHTRNIIVGASLGIIAGVGYVAFSQATRTQEMMYGAEEVSLNVNPKLFGTSARVAWHYEKFSSELPVALSPYQFNYQIKF